MDQTIAPKMDQVPVLNPDGRFVRIRMPIAGGKFMLLRLNLSCVRLLLLLGSVRSDVLITYDIEPSFSNLTTTQEPFLRMVELPGT